MAEKSGTDTISHISQGTDSLPHLSPGTEKWIKDAPPMELFESLVERGSTDERISEVLGYAMSCDQNRKGLIYFVHPDQLENVEKHLAKYREILTEDYYTTISLTELRIRAEFFSSTRDTDLLLAREKKYIDPHKIRK